MEISYSELSRLTGKSYRAIRALLESAGLKPIKSGGKGKAHLWDSRVALEAIYCPATIDEGGQLDLNAERAREAKERADRLELENAVRRGELLETKDVGRELSAAIVMCKTKITGLPSKLSAMVDDLDERRRLFIEAKATTDEALIDLANGFQKCGAETETT